ncbi:MAG: exodeoxyribonuclease VII small subunit [Dehalococcoidia bacterium]|nr:exodeoxyribonuclease VII small subunit [Dehalococcoidia bacterium]
MASEGAAENQEAPENQSFEEAMALLEQTVQALESGGLTLAESTAMYERGMKLARVCNEMLNSAEARITRIRTTYGEQIRMVAPEDDGFDSMEDIG